MINGALGINFYKIAVDFIGEVPSQFEIIYAITTIIIIIFTLYIPFYIVNALKGRGDE